MPPEIFGGVGTLTNILADFLRDANHKVTIAFPATRSHRPELNSYSPFQKPKARSEMAFNDHDCVAVGNLFPELEYTYSEPSSLWQKLIDEHDYHVVVSGTVALAQPLISADVPHLVWCASDVLGDRIDRRKKQGLVRRVFDKFIVTPALLRQQTSVLNGSGHIVAISPFTQNILQDIFSGVDGKIEVLAIPTDTDVFQPPEHHKTEWNIGCAGRLTDPRKNVDLIFDVIRDLREDGQNVKLSIAGDVSDDLIQKVSRRGLNDCVAFKGRLDLNDFVAFYQNLDVLIISSFQEGHAIVGIEAMACGVPVVSTRCGGPEAYIKSGENGFLVDFDSLEMAARVHDICSSSSFRNQLSVNARNTAVSEFGMPRFEKELESQWKKTFGNEIDGS